MDRSEDKPTSWPLRILGGVALAGVGAAMGYFISGQVREGNLPWDDALALFMAALLAGTGAAMVYVLASRPSTIPKGCGVLQIVVMVLAGLLYAAPVVAPETLSAEAVFAAILAILAVQTFANVMLWQKADEMLRRVMLETAALAFVVCQFALFIYAAAERLGLTGGVSAWGMIGILMLIYLFASAFAAARRGMK